MLPPPSSSSDVYSDVWLGIGTLSISLIYSMVYSICRPGWEEMSHVQLPHTSGQLLGHCRLTSASLRYRRYMYGRVCACRARNILIGQTDKTVHVFTETPRHSHSSSSNQLHFPALGLGVFQEFLYGIAPSLSVLCLPIPVICEPEVAEIISHII